MKTYHIYVQLLYIADVFRFGHTTYFDNKRSHGSYCLLYLRFIIHCSQRFLCFGFLDALYEAFQRVSRLRGFHKGFSDKEASETGGAQAADGFGVRNTAFRDK